MYDNCNQNWSITGHECIKNVEVRKREKLKETTTDISFVRTDMVLRILSEVTSK